MKALLVKYKRTILGLAFGAMIGFGYWYFIGCSSGSCMITSSPLNSTLYFSFAGALLANSFSKDQQKNKTNELEN